MKFQNQDNPRSVALKSEVDDSLNLNNAPRSYMTYICSAYIYIYLNINIHIHCTYIRYMVAKIKGTPTKVPDFFRNFEEPTGQLPTQT